MLCGVEVLLSHSKCQSKDVFLATLGALPRGWQCRSVGWFVSVKYSTTSRLIGTTSCTDNHSFQGINPCDFGDFSSSTNMWLMSVPFDEISQQLLDQLS